MLKFNSNIISNIGSVAATVIIALILAGMWAQARDSKITELDRRVTLLEAQNVLVVAKLASIESIVLRIETQQAILHRGQLPNRGH